MTRGAHNLRSEQVDYKRNEFRATVTQFFDVGGTNHQLKGGFGYEEGSEVLDRKSNGWGTLAIVSNGIQATYYTEQPAQVSPGKTYSLFVQDDISIGSRLVVNAGVLLNRDEYSQVLAAENTFLTFGFGDEVQPRIGRQLSVAERRRRQDLREFRALLCDGPEEQRPLPRTITHVLHRHRVRPHDGSDNLYRSASEHDW